MPAQNRVTPTSEIVALDQRGMFMGNRGCLHRGREVVRSWSGKRWITCAAEFRGRRVQQWAPGRYTPLFFWDEAVALAAGHRPCAECRRQRYRQFQDAWRVAHGGPEGADAMDARLHVDRLDGRVQRRHARPWHGLPPGTFVHHQGMPSLVLADAVVGWSAAGYGEARERPPLGTAEVLTPAATVEVLLAGYAPDLHPVVTMEPQE